MSVVGQKIIAPNGYRGLRSDREYHYVGRCNARGIVTLCFFDSEVFDVFVEVLQTASFEQGLIDDHLVPVDDEVTSPPWISQYSDRKDEHQFSMSLVDFTKKNRPHIDRWRKTLGPLFEAADEILSVINPEKEINKRLAGRVSKSQFRKGRTLFFAYLCFGRSETALLPNTWKNGRFKRDDTEPKRKYGRKNEKTGEFSGHHCGNTERDLCIKGYEENKKLGRPYSQIYRASLESHFDCRHRLVGKEYETYQPEGKRFPSFAQFMSRVFNHFGKQSVHELRYSAERVRRTRSEHIGTYAQQCSNLMERTEADVYYVAETTRGVVAEYSTVMCIARALDTSSSLRMGIGCSLDGERSEAYAMAEFSMGVPKDIFCSYFGLTIDPEFWPSVGLPMRHIVDRGAGSKEELLGKILDHTSHVELAVSGSGQSKAPVESANPRKTTLEGAPCYVVSHLDPFNYFKREIVRTMTENWTSDIAGRLTKGMIQDSVKPRPIHVWNYLSARLRTDGTRPSFESLVRTYLPKRKVKISRKGAALSMLRFKSPALRASGICERVSGNRSFELEAYVVPMSLRQIWIDYKGELIEAYLVPELIDGEDEANWTVADLADIAKRRRDLETACRTEDHAIHLAASQMFSEQVGMPYYGGSTQQNKPKRKRHESMDELARIHEIFGGRR